jgi:hypothetical protein
MVPRFVSLTPELVPLPFGHHLRLSLVALEEVVLVIPPVIVGVLLRSLLPITSATSLAKVRLVFVIDHFLLKSLVVSLERSVTGEIVVVFSIGLYFATGSTRSATRLDWWWIGSSEDDSVVFNLDVYMAWCGFFASGSCLLSG